MQSDICKSQNGDGQQRHGRHPWLRTLFALGLCAMCAGGYSIVLAEGFGGSPPPLATVKRDKIIGIAAALAGATISIGAAIRLYFVEKPVRNPG